MRTACCLPTPLAGAYLLATTDLTGSRVKGNTAGPLGMETCGMMGCVKGAEGFKQHFRCGHPESTHAHCGDTPAERTESPAEQDTGQNGERETGEGWREGPLPLTLTLAPLPAGCPWFSVLGHQNLLCI